MIIQTFKTICENCDEEVTHKVGNMTGDNDIIVDFLDGMMFECECGKTTYLEVEKYSND